MTRLQLYALSSILLGSLAIAACTSTGMPAIGKGNVISVPATVTASCGAVSAGDAQFQAFAAQHPGKIDANGMNAEGTVVVSFFARAQDGMLTPQPGGVCDPKASVNFASAEITLLGASLQIANLLATWQK